MSEIWKDVKGYEGLYKVSNLGRVISYHHKPIILKQAVNSRGYSNINLCKNKTQKNVQVHQLVAVAFLNHTINGHKIVVDHIDGNKTNNTVSNLQLITNRENSTKDRKNGTSKYPGVSWHKYYNKWQAQIQIDGKKIYLGRYSNELDAAKAYQEKLKSITV